MSRRRLNLHHYIDHIVATIFVVTALTIIGVIIALIISIPWLVGITEQLVDKL